MAAKPAFFLCLLVLAAVYLVDSRPVKHAPGVLAPNEPDQTPATGGGWNLKQYHFTPLADFRLTGLILDTEPYWFDGASALSPVDFAIGWGPMSDSRILDQIGITQGGRWYHCNPRGSAFPIPAEEIMSHSANMHMIPSSLEIRRRLKSVHPGDIVKLSGESGRSHLEGGLEVAQLSNQDRHRQRLL